MYLCRVNGNHGGDVNSEQLTSRLTSKLHTIQRRTRSRGSYMPNLN